LAIGRENVWGGESRGEDCPIVREEVATLLVLKMDAIESGHDAFSGNEGASNARRIAVNTLEYTEITGSNASPGLRSADASAHTTPHSTEHGVISS